MDNLSPLELALSNEPIDKERFWIVLSVLEEYMPEHAGRKYNQFQATRLRFWPDGSVAHTYQEIADFFGSSPEHIRTTINAGLRIMRRPEWKKYYLPRLMRK